VLGQRQYLEHARVVDQHIDLAQLRLGFIEQALYVVSAAHVCLHGNRFMAVFAQLRDQLGSFAGAAGVVDDHGKPFPGQLFGNNGTDAARGAGNDGDSGL